MDDVLPSARLPLAEQRRILGSLLHAASLRRGVPMSAVTVDDLLAPTESQR